MIRTIRPLDREQAPQITFEIVAHSGILGSGNRFHEGTASSTATVVVTVRDKNDNAPYMVLLASPDRKKAILAEVVIPPGGLNRDPACVPFSYAFQDDDDPASGNGNVSITLDANPNFIFNEDHTQLCYKVDKKKKISSPPPGRYSLNILAQDNPRDSAHRLTKRFPLRVLVQSTIQEFHSPEGGTRHREDLLPRFKPSMKSPGGLGPHESQSPVDRIMGGRRRQPPPSRLPAGSGLTGGEYRNVTIIAVLVCMACILCIILLAILLFVKKCAPVKNLVTKSELILLICLFSLWTSVCH